MTYSNPEPFEESDFDAFAGAEGWKSGPEGNEPPWLMEFGGGVGVAVADRHGVEVYLVERGNDGFRLKMHFPTAATAYFFLIGMQKMDNDIEDEVALEEVGFVPI
jgi:hypothetical protein